MKIAKRIIFISLIVIFILPVCYCVNYVFQKSVLQKRVPVFFGISHAIVVSPSMAPTINVHDLVFVKSQSKYNIGDVVSFYEPSIGTVTHRIVRQNADGSFVTKGDNVANSEDPSAITDEDIYGKVVLVSKFMGNVISFLQTTEGLVTLGMIVVCGVVIYIIVKNIKKSKEEY